MDKTGGNGHTLKFFGVELEKLRSTVERMGDLARDQVFHAAEAIGRGNVDVARDVTEVDDQMHALKRDVDKAAVRIMALHQPVAQDLRLALSAIRISALLERVGDLANNTAKRAALLADDGPDSALALAALARVGGFARHSAESKGALSAIPYWCSAATLSGWESLYARDLS